jgi:hypothetical protein
VGYVQNLLNARKMQVASRNASDEHGRTHTMGSNGTLMWIISFALRLDFSAL